MIEFTIPGEPVPKGRPKFTTIGGRPKAYTPAKTREYEKLVQGKFLETHSEALQGPLRVEITLCLKIPKGTSKKAIQAMLEGKTRHMKKPDVDNVAKCILDALNKLAYNDDGQICELEVKKWYSNFPRAEGKIFEI